MFHLFEKAACPIGVDIGGHALRLMQFKKASREGEALALQAACQLELEAFPGTDVEKCIAALRHGLAAQAFLGKRVVVALPAHLLQAKSIRLPQMPDSDLTQALGWEAKDRFGFEVGDASAPPSPQSGQPSPGRLAWFRAGEVRRGTEVKDELHLFAVPGDPLNAYIQAFTTVGLRIAAIDLAPCAAFRSLVRATPALGTGTAALLDVGHQGAQLMVTCDGELVFYKHIDIGGKKISEAISAKLGISPLEATQMRARFSQDSAAAQDAAPLHQALRDAMRAPLEELSRELDMCLRYYVITFRGARPDALRLFGRQASCPFLKESLAGALGLPIEEAQPLRGVQSLGDAARPDRSGQWAVAAGLSLYPESTRKEAAA